MRERGVCSKSGRASGYATLWLAAAVPPQGLLLTIERDQGRAALARRHIEQAGLSSRVVVIAGDARTLPAQGQWTLHLVFQTATLGFTPSSR